MRRLIIIASLFMNLCLPTGTQASNGGNVSPDPNFQIYLCFGQSNMEGNAAIEDIDRTGVNPRFMAMYAVDDEKAGWKKGQWHTAVPPQARPDITGPYVDNVGREMLQGGGKMVIAANNLKTGPGHFGRYIEEEGVEKMSFHYESDFRQGGRSVLAIRPLLWKNDWPVAGDEFHAGTYEIESERRGYALEIAVDFVRMQRDIEPFWIKPTKPLKNIEPQTLKEVEAGWPKGEVKVRMNDYMFRPHQKWSIMPAGKGGYLGGPYYKICIEGTTRYLTATAQYDVIAKPEFTGEDAQLWRIEQLTDGTYRIMPKAVPGTEEKLALVSLGDCTPGLAPFDFNSDNSKWNFRQQ